MVRNLVVLVTDGISWDYHKFASRQSLHAIGSTHGFSPIVPANPKLAIEAGLVVTGLKLARIASKDINGQWIHP